MKELPTIACITCTRGRHSLLERNVGLFLKQDYKGKMYQIIFNNSPVEQKLADGVDERVILVNSHKDYKTLKEIFDDAMTHVPEDVEVVTFFDDDDVFLPNHVSEGAKGYIEAKEMGKVAYKPMYSLIQTLDKVEKMRNMFEPSWFVSKEWVLKHGFNTHSAAYHHEWILPILKSSLLHEPENGIPTFVYQWVGGCFHISGDGDNPSNLSNHNRYSTDEGDGVITPIIGT